MRSNNSPRVLRRLVGLKELESVLGLLGFGIGIAFSAFHVAGKWPNCRSMLKSKVR